MKTPKLAREIVRRVVAVKLAAAGERARADNRWDFIKDPASLVLELFEDFTYESVYYENGSIRVPVKSGSFAWLCSMHLDLPVAVPLEDLQKAGPKERYFGRMSSY